MMSTSLQIRPALVAGLALAGLVGCFSERAATTAPDDSSPSIGKEACSAATHPAGVVLIRNFAFQPAEVRVPAGGRVTWVNCDTDAHTSTSDGGAATKWNSGIMAAGASFSQTFDNAGTSAYHCDPHPFMKGTVVVQ